MQDDFIALPLAPAPVERPRSGRARTWVLVGAAAGVLTLGGGAVALAAGTSGGSGPIAGYGRGPEGGMPAGAAPGSGTRAAPVHQPHLDGTVKSVSGSTVLITDRDGFTRTIKLSSATKYTDSLSAAKLTKGTKIHAEGTVDADQTSLDATSVGTMPAGGPGRGGPGGFGGHGPAGRGPAAPAPGSTSSGSGASSAAPTPSSTSS